MKNKKIIFGILTSSNNYDNNLNLNIEIYKKIFKVYGNFCILNVSNLRIFKSKDTSPERKSLFFSKKIKIYKPNSLHELKSIFEGKTLIAFNNLGKTFSYFKIYLFLNLIDLKQILLLNIDQSNNFKIFINTKKVSSFFISLLFSLRKNFVYYIFRILTIINVFPKIEAYFESSIKVVNSVNGGFSKKFENLFPFTKFSYFRNVYRINSKSFDFKKKITPKNKYITFIDTNFENQDRVYREGKIDKNIKKKYYNNLQNLFFYLNKIFKKEIIFCIHPSNKDKTIYKSLKNFKIVKYKTSEFIKDSHIVLFHESSPIMDAVILKKKIICLKSSLLGTYLTDRTNNYQNLLGVFSINLKNNYSFKKKYVLNEINKSQKKLNAYIKQNLQADNEQLGSDKVIKIFDKIIKREK